MRKSIAQKKKYLKQYEFLKLQFDRILSKTVECRVKAKEISAVNIENLGIRSSSHNNPVEIMLIKEERYLKDLDKVTAKMNEIKEAIDKVDDVLLSSILELNYCDGKDFYDIAHELGYSLSAIRHLHTQALDVFKIPNSAKESQIKTIQAN